MVESDSSVSISLIHYPGLVTHKYAAVLKEIQFWLQKYWWQVRVIHTYREGNFVADWLVNFGQCKDICLHLLTNPTTRSYLSGLG